jgi:hypothetical protein
MHGLVFLPDVLRLASDIFLSLRVQALMLCGPMQCACAEFMPIRSTHVGAYCACVIVTRHLFAQSQLRSITPRLPQDVLF